MRQHEAVQEYQEILKGGPKTETEVDSVHSRKNKFPTARKRQKGNRNHILQAMRNTQGAGRAYTQGKSAQLKKRFATGVSHYKEQCLSKGVGEVATTSISTVEQSDAHCDDIAYSNTVYKNSSNSWNCQVIVNEVTT